MTMFTIVYILIEEKKTDKKEFYDNRLILLIYFDI